jgi:error-prone DNA polymerase
VRSRYRREGGVSHLIAEHLIDLSDLLRSLSDPDDSFRCATAAARPKPARDRLREGPKETIDAPSPELPEKQVHRPVTWRHRIETIFGF